MGIRRKLDKKWESMSEDIKPYHQMFLGDVVGVVLRNRTMDDPHVCFQMIHEDDGHWFLSDNGASSFWFSDYEGVLKAAREWCEKNCDPDYGHRPEDQIQYGWKFRD